MSPTSGDFDWTRDESRYVDGELDAEAMRRLTQELAADPMRSEHVDRYREAMDLWRDDAPRRAARLESRVLADRILRAEGSSSKTAVATRATRRYAAAALVLLGLGVAGAAWVGPQRGPTDAHAATLTIERERMDLQGDWEWNLFASPEAVPPEEER